MFSKKQRKGRRAEFLARLWFILHGYRILYKNYITGHGTTAGEVDFIAKRGENIVFVEVKARQKLEDAVFSILPKQQKRLISATRYFIQKHPEYRSCNFRFDAFFVVSAFKFLHIKNAWQID